MIHAIFFDLDGTLFHRAEAHRRYSLDLINRRPDVFLDARREADLEFLTEAADDPAWNRRAFARRVAERYPALGMTHAELARDHAARLARFVEPDAGISKLFASLADQRRLAIVSNGSSQVQRAKLAMLGLGELCPRAFISGELGIAKPDPRLFRMALEWTECRADEALFVGDDPAIDIAGAAGLKMTTCWVAGGRSYPLDLPPPDLTIDRVAELEKILR